MLIRMLLEASKAADSPTTFLAASCAEVTSFVPDAIRVQVEHRLRSAAPPRSNIQIAHFVDDIGEIAAPALLGALAAATADERAFIVTALGRMDDPPIVRRWRGS